MADDPDALHDLLLGVRRSVRYHHHWRHFFDNLGRWKTWLSLVFGLTAMATLLARSPPAIPLAASILVTAIPALDLVVGCVRKARLHSDLMRRFTVLERDMLVCPQPTAETIRDWTARRLAIEADEPPILRLLDVFFSDKYE